METQANPSKVRIIEIKFHPSHEALPLEEAPRHLDAGAFLKRDHLGNVGAKKTGARLHYVIIILFLNQQIHSISLFVHFPLPCEEDAWTIRSVDGVLKKKLRPFGYCSVGS